LNDDKVNWCEKVFFAKWEAFNGKSPLPLHVEELLDKEDEDNNNSNRWTTLSHKSNNKK